MSQVHDIVPIITKNFVDAMLEAEGLALDHEAGEEVDEDLLEAAHDHAMALKECFLALYPNLMSDPLETYKAALHPHMEGEESDAAEQLWLGARQEIEVSQEAPQLPDLEIPGPPGQRTRRLRQHRLAQGKENLQFKAAEARRHAGDRMENRRHLEWTTKTVSRPELDVDLNKRSAERRSPQFKR